MSEDKIINTIKPIVNARKTHKDDNLYSLQLNAYQLDMMTGLLDLYQKEKEKNRELERYKRIANQKLDDIEEFRKNECNHRCIKDAELKEFKEYIFNSYISKDKMREKIKNKIECCKAEELENCYPNDKHSMYWEMFRKLLENLEEELLEDNKNEM